MLTCAHHTAWCWKKQWAWSLSFSGLTDSLLPARQTHWTWDHLHEERRPQGTSSADFPSPPECPLSCSCADLVALKWERPWTLSKPICTVFKPPFIPSLASLAHLHLPANNTSLPGQSHCYIPASARPLATLVRQKKKTTPWTQIWRLREVASLFSCQAPLPSFQFVLSCRFWELDLLRNCTDLMWKIVIAIDK